MRAYGFYIVIMLHALLSCGKNEIEVDLAIHNGIVYDGRQAYGLPWSIGLKGDRIVYAGNEKDVKLIGKRTIDATGLIVCPGFIDPHTHADRELRQADKSHNLPFLMQGVTTVVAGNDGDSFFPLSKFKKLYTEHGIGTNAVLLTGHSTLRKLAVGRSDKKASREEIKNMKSALEREMKDGSFGLSTGLFYAPGSYADTEEIIELAKVAAQYGGIYDTHLRDESAYTIGLKAAVEEAIEIGRKARLPVHISHIKCLGVDVWNQSDEIIRLIEENRNTGLEVTANQYPYQASATGLQSAVVPRWAESGGKDSLFIRYEHSSLRQKILIETKKNITRRGGPEKLLMVMVEDTAFLGKNLLEIADNLGLSPEEAVFPILQSGSVRVASFNMTKNDIENYMRQPWVVTGSDGNTGHPRKYGTFPRKYYKYVCQDSVIDLGQFIRNSSARTAEIFGIPDRGQLAEGYFADIIVFDPKTFRDVADYSDAFQLATGLKYSIINGQFSVDNGLYTKALNGVVITK